MGCRDMSFLLWTDEEKDEAIDLGDPFTLMTTFQEIIETLNAAGTTKEYGELSQVPAMGEQEVNSKWLRKVQNQAVTVMKEHKGELSHEANAVLKLLSNSVPRTPIKTKRSA